MGSVLRGFLPGRPEGEGEADPKPAQEGAMESRPDSCEGSAVAGLVG